MPPALFSIGANTLRFTLREDKRNDSSFFTSSRSVGFHHASSSRTKSSLSSPTTQPAPFLFNGYQIRSASPSAKRCNISAISRHSSIRNITPNLSAKRFNPSLSSGEGMETRMVFLLILAVVAAFACCGYASCHWARSSSTAAVTVA